MAKTKKSNLSKIIIGVFGLLLIGGTVAGTLLYSQSGERFTGSIIPSTDTPVSATCTYNGGSIFGLIDAAEPYDWNGVTNEKCTCDTSKHYLKNIAQIPYQTRLENFPTPCVCEQQYSDKGGYCEPNGCPAVGLAKDGVIEVPPYNYDGILNEQCACDNAAGFKLNPDLPRNTSGEQPKTRLENATNPCICADGKELVNGECVTAAQSSQDLIISNANITTKDYVGIQIDTLDPNQKAIIIDKSGTTLDQKTDLISGCPAEKNLVKSVKLYTFNDITDESCACDDSRNFEINPAILKTLVSRDTNTLGDTANKVKVSGKRLEDYDQPCTCKDGYMYSQVGNVCLEIAENRTQCPLPEVMDANCQCPNNNYYDSVNNSCIEITCSLDNSKVQQVYLHNQASYDGTTPASRTKLEDYYDKEGTYETDCLQAGQIECPIGQILNSAGDGCVPIATSVDANINIVTQPNADSSTSSTSSNNSTSSSSKTLSCSELKNLLSDAYYDEDWREYDDIMVDIEKENCYNECKTNFYWTVLYISVRDLFGARPYYKDTGCEDCVLSTDLASYAAELMSDYRELERNDERLLRELVRNSLDFCPEPGSLQNFFDTLIWDAVKYYGRQSSTNYNKGFAGLFPTAYAQSTDFSTDVENLISDEYGAKYGDSGPRCRSLDIIKPEEAVGDQPTIKIPLNGFKNQELAIEIDTDPNIVSLYRYKSLEGSITFDNQGNIYDTIKTSVLMNNTEIKGDIVTVWAMDEDLKGIQECHDAFYVEPQEQKTVLQTPPAAIAQIEEEPVVEETVLVSEPQYIQQLHGSAITPGAHSDTGPGILIYILSAGLGGTLILKKKRTKNSL